MSRARHTETRRHSRSSVLIVSGAAVVAMWVGLTAPTVSPVNPPPLPAGPVAVTTAPVAPGAIDPQQAGP